MNNTNIVVVLAGGSGVRYQGDKPKQFTTINGRELLGMVIEELRKSVLTDQLLVVLNDDEEELARIREQYHVTTIVGGRERAYSFQNALDYIRENEKNCKKVIFHESARPLVPYTIIDKYFELLDEYDYVESCKKIHDSLGSYIMDAPRREDFFLIQAPEAYRLSVLVNYYDCDSDIYFAANQFPAFLKGYQCFDMPYNIKLTTPDDRILIEYLLNCREKEQNHE